MWLQDLLIILNLLLLLAGLFMSRRLVSIGRWEAVGLMIGAFYFIFIPLIVTSKLKMLDYYLPPFPSTSLPLAILFVYMLETLLIFRFLAREKPGHARPTSLNREMFIYRLTLAVYFAMQLYVLFASGLLQGGHWYFTRAEFLADAGAGATLAIFAIWAARLIIVSYTFEFLHLKLLTISKAGVIVALIMGYEFLFVGNRIVILMFGIAGFFYIAKRFGFPALIAVIASLFPIMISLGVYQDVRRFLYQLNPLEFVLSLIQEVANQNILLGLSKVFESADLLIMLDLFERTGDTVEPIYGSSFFKVFTWFIPRSVWAAKPITVTELVGEIHLPGRGVSLVPLFWGEVHYNFGILGLFLYPLILWLVLKAIEILCNRVSLNNYLKLLTGFLIFRLPVSDTIISIIVLALIYLGTIYFWETLPKKKPAANIIMSSE